MVGYFGLAAVLCTIFFRTRPAQSPSPVTESEDIPIVRAFLSCVTKRNFWLIAPVFWIMASMYWSLGVLLDATMTSVGYTTQQTSIPGILFMAIAIPAMVFIGYYLDNTRRFWYASMLSSVGAVVFLALFTFAVQVPSSESYGYGLTIFAVTAAGFFFSTLQPALLEFVAEASYPANEGMSCMLMYLGTQVTGIVYNMVYAPLSKASGTPTVPNAVYTAICAAAAVVLAFSAAAPHLRSQAEDASTNWAITGLAARELEAGGGGTGKNKATATAGEK